MVRTGVFQAPNESSILSHPTMKYTQYGFTGTRKGMTNAQKEVLRDFLRKATSFRHGNCIGSDELAHFLFREFHPRGRIIIHPATTGSKQSILTKDDPYCDWMEPLPPLSRNRVIVLSSNLLLATPETEKEVLRSGTWATIRFARQQKRPHVIIYPEGSLFISNGARNG